MIKTTRVVAVITILLGVASAVISQRPLTSQTSTGSSTSTPVPATAPSSVNAKYEGGVFGYKKRLNGTLNFDDPNQRLMFRDNNGKETGVSLPYKSITGAYADTHKVRPAAATAAGEVPYIYALPAHFIKKKVQYLTIQYDDPDSHVAGVTSFKLDNKDILNSVLYTLAAKSGLDRRGEIFVRKKP